MRCAILGESAADEAAVETLLGALIGDSFERVHRGLKAPGWPAVRNLLPVTIKRLQFSSDTDALIVIADSNHTSVQEGASPNRLDELNGVARQTLQGLAEVPGRDRLMVAVGIAVPAMEAWLLAPDNPRLSEAAWEEGLKNKRDPYTKNELKKQLYGTDRPAFELEKERMISAAGTVAQNIPLLEKRFPQGFGTLVQTVREWL